MLYLEISWYGGGGVAGRNEEENLGCVTLGTACGLDTCSFEACFPS